MTTSPTLAKRTRSFDGTDLTYHVAGERGPWVILVHGLGAGLAAWRHPMAYLGDRFRFLSWDYRGLHEPAEDAPPPSSSKSPVELHAQDMAAVLAAENVRGGIWMGWSLGAQVTLEAFRRHEAHPDLLVLVNPCYGHGPNELAPRHRLFLRAIGAMQQAPWLLEPVVRRAASWPETSSWLKRLGFVAPSIDEALLAEVVRDFQGVRLIPYLDAVRASSIHPVDGMLKDIDVPTLAILGERDAVTPRATAEPMARQIPNAEVFVIRGATHFALLEFPELINLRVEKFLREHGM